LIYEYENLDTGEVIEKEFSMASDIPQMMIINGIKFKRKWSLGHGGIHVPESFKADDYKFDKSPSGRKHFY
jgi:hypothetical protein